MHMESPERHPFGASLEGQESPLFNFLCSLSPIKPIKSMHMSQSFTELSFPPPPAVFVTPRVHLKSSLHRSKYKSKQAHEQSDQNCIHHDNRQDVPCLVEGSDGTTQEQDNIVGLLCTRSSKLVEHQVAEPMEVESKTASSVLSPLVCEAKASRSSPEMVLSARDLGQCNSLSVEATGTPPDMLCKLLGNDKNGEQRASLVGNSEVPQGSRLTKSLNGVHFYSYGSSNDKQALELDQEAADLVLFLSEVADKTPPLHENLEGWQRGALSSLSDIPVDHTEACLSTFNGNVDEEVQDRHLDTLPMQMTTDCGDSKGANVSTGAQKEATNKVNFPVQRGFRRRCLDFRVSEGRWKSKSTSSSVKAIQSNLYYRSQNNSTHSSDPNIHLTVLKERTLATSDATNSDSMPVETSKRKFAPCHFLEELGCAPADLAGQLRGTCPPSGASPAPPPNMPCGIGLHLNSLTRSMPMLQSSRAEDEGNGFSASVTWPSAVVESTSPSRMQSADKDDVFLSSVNFGNSTQTGASLEEGELIVSLVEKAQMGVCSDHIISASDSVACAGSLATRIKQLRECVPYGGLEKSSSPLDQERVLLPAVRCQLDIDGGQEASTLSGKKARKRAFAADSSEDGCKRCNCKKSKCLKLYCECFAAGVFCVDSCSCHDCHNKPSFQGMVVETRQQIESRNPLAFAPKIVRAQASSPMTGEHIIDVTPASARHKKGCSCKKSKCLKKYCECYQAGVGCSEGCRCENCQNLYGRKEECSEGKVESNGKEATKEKMDTSEFCSEFKRVSRYQHDDLSPITPSFQPAGQVSPCTIYRSAARRRVSNEESQSLDCLLPSSEPPRTFYQPLGSSKAARNSFVVSKTGRQLSSSPGCTPKSLRSGQFSPRWDGLDDICTLTPLAQAPLRPTTLSASFVYGTDSSSTLSVQQCSGPLSSGSDSVGNMNNLGQCASPIICQQGSDSCINNYCVQTPTNSQSTPMTPAVHAPFCEMGLESPYEDSTFLCTKVVGSSEDDAIPEILKDPEPPARPSIFSLKSNSPKQKRVSPPHFVGLRITSQGKGQSPALRNGRKFTLQSVSSTATMTYSAI